MANGFNDQMEKHHVLIWNADDPVIFGRIEPYDYTIEKLAAGKSLYQEVITLNNDQDSKSKEEKSAEGLFIHKRDEEKNNLKKFRKLVKQLLKKNHEASSNLHLNVPLPSKYADWINAAKYFYTGLLNHPEWVSLISATGCTTESLTANIEALLEIETLHENHLRKTGDTQRATLARNKKFDELKLFCSDLRALAKLLFTGDDAQYLEKLGIVVRKLNANIKE